MTADRPAAPTTNHDGEVERRWIASPMTEPWHRDLIAGTIAQHSADLAGWAERIAYTYSRSGTLEITAVIWALLDDLDAARAALAASGGGAGEKLRRVEALAEELDFHRHAYPARGLYADRIRAALDGPAT